MIKHVNQGKSSLGVEANIIALLSYLLGFVTGAIFFVLERENKFVKFHAMQSVLVFGTLFILSVLVRFLPFVGFIIVTLLGIVEIALWIILMVKAYQGEYFKLPIAGELAFKKTLSK